MALTLVCGDYDRTRRVLDGRIPVEGCQLDCRSLPAEEMFSRAFERAEFDVTELSFSNFMMHSARGTCAYVGLPIFPSRTFRHSAIYIRSDCGIERPADLKGKTVGVREYSNTASLVARGMLDDEYGVSARDVCWRVGDVDRVERDRIEVPDMPAGFDVQPVPVGTLLSHSLANGALDALIAYVPPRCFLDGHPQVSRLFPDFVAAERDYFARTRIFPIMHLLGVRRSLLEREPWLARSLYAAFTAAKDAALADLRPASALKIALPWMGEEAARTRALMGDDYWPYGVAANRPAIDALIRYSAAQGLTAPQLTIDRLFAGSLLDT